MWKVIGYMEPPGYSRAAGGEVYGPLPCKKWIGPHVEKKRHVKAHVPRPCDDKDAKRKRDEHRAIEYVRWLAKRDGVELPARGEIRPVWGSVESTTRMYRGRPTYEPRIRAVEWGHQEEVYNERKNGRRGAWLYNQFVADFRFDIPNWDFNPAMPAEEILDDFAEAA